jgi:hypothetical protein
MKIIPISAISSARNMSDPFKWLPSTAQRWVLLISILLSLSLLLVMHSLDGQLITAASPRGIVSFELSGSIESAAQILKLWGPQGKVYAALSLGLDYLFLIVYALFISLSCVRIADYFRQRGRHLAICGLGLGWAQFLAAFLDAIENAALINLIFDSQRDSWPTIARYCALLKFGIVGLGLAYIFSGTLFMIIMNVLHFIKSGE